MTCSQPAFQDHHCSCCTYDACSSHPLEPGHEREASAHYDDSSPSSHLEMGAFFSLHSLAAQVVKYCGLVLLLTFL